MCPARAVPWAASLLAQGPQLPGGKGYVSDGTGSDACPDMSQKIATAGIPHQPHHLVLLYLSGSLSICKMARNQSNIDYNLLSKEESVCGLAYISAP